MASSIPGPGAMNAQISLQQARESQILQQVQSATGPDQKEKIAKGARQFETLLLQGWLQQAEETLATVPGADDDEDGGGQQTMTSMGVQSLAEAMAGAGGIGLGSMIEKAMLSMAQKLQAPGDNPAENQRLPLNSGSQNADRMAVSQKGSG